MIEAETKNDHRLTQKPIINAKYRITLILVTDRYEHFCLSKAIWRGDLYKGNYRNIPHDNPATPEEPYNRVPHSRSYDM